MNINYEGIMQSIMDYGIKIFGALLVLVIGLRVIRYIVKLTSKAVVRANIDESLKPFLVSITNIGLKILLFISVISTIGVHTASLATVVGAAGLAVGLAFQGSLSNFAGGVLLLILKPFKVGDFIETSGQMGSVKEIQVFHTYLVTPDNKMVIIPNGSIANSNIVNFSFNSERRVDLVFGVGYESDEDQVIGIIRDVIDKHELIKKDPEAMVVLSELADSSINFTVRVWTKKEDYWTVHFDLLRNVKKELDKNKISIPYPQMDVHVRKDLL
ncbi:MAG: mechanosensitive ion channel [Firmicutes bacterium]|jgi:small conductance mechanosensitive channel|nr:mechanosensitive ion channel [Bacillota bacterium]